MFAELGNSEDFDILDLWEEISEELSEIVLGYIDPTEEISAIDNLLNVSDETHQ